MPKNDFIYVKSGRDEICRKLQPHFIQTKMNEDSNFGGGFTLEGNPNDKDKEFIENQTVDKQLFVVCFQNKQLFQNNKQLFVILNGVRIWLIYLKISTVEFVTTFHKIYEYSNLNVIESKKLKCPNE